MRVMMINYFDIFPVTTGGRIASYGYLKMLENIATDLRVLILEPHLNTETINSGIKCSFAAYTPISCRIPNITFSQNTMATKEAFICSGIITNNLMYEDIKNYKPDIIVTNASLDFNRISNNINVFRYTFDSIEKHIEETIPNLTINDKTNIEKLCEIMYKNYKGVFCCSSIDEDDRYNIKYVPFYVPIKNTTHTNTLESYILLSGSKGWHRFEKSVNWCKQSLLDKLPQDTKLYIYCKNAESYGKHNKIHYNSNPHGYDPTGIEWLIQPQEYLSGIPCKILEAMSHGIPTICESNTFSSIFNQYEGIFDIKNIENIIQVKKRVILENKIKESLTFHHGLETTTKKMREKLCFI